MKRIILIVSLLIAFFVSAQEQKNDIDTKIKLGAGVFMPQGKLQNFLSNSPYFEIGLDFSMFERDNFGFALQVVIPTQQELFMYTSVQGQTENVKATYITNIVFNFRQQLVKTEKSVFELRLGVGGSGIHTDLRNPRYSGHKDENKYEMISAILINPSIEYIRKFSDTSTLNLAIGFHYAPYKVEGAVQQDIGGLALVPKIMYTF